MNTNNIICPNCRTEIPLTDAITHRVREQMESEFASRQRQAEAVIQEREKAAAEQLKQIESQKQTIDAQVAEKLARERENLKTQALEKAKQGVAVELQDLQAQLRENQQRLAEAQEKELESRKKQREVQERAAALELEVARKLDAERETIRQQAAATAVEAERLKMAEKEKVISDLQQQIGILKQKAEQGSMQLQGEVLELDLESQLSVMFPHDVFEPVSKGVRGADLLQKVLTNLKHDCGAVLWEAKRAKTWSNAWIAKLKEDQRSAKAEIAVLVTQVLPADIKHFGFAEGVWVCDFTSVLPLAVALRQGLVKAAMVELSEIGKAGKMEELYHYVCSLEFRQHVEAIVESFGQLHDDLEKERRAMEKLWAQHEKQIRRAAAHTAMLYGGIQGIAGQAALPGIASLQLGPIEKSEENAPV